MPDSSPFAVRRPRGGMHTAPPDGLTGGAVCMLNGCPCRHFLGDASRVELGEIRGHPLALPGLFGAREESSAVDETPRVFSLSELPFLTPKFLAQMVFVPVCLVAVYFLIGS